MYAVDCKNQVINDEADVENEVDGHEVVLKHFVDGKGASQNPEESVDPNRLIHISLLLPSQNQSRKVPSQRSKQIKKTM